MITNVNLLSVWVENLDRAKDFYVGKLGFELRDDSGNWWVVVERKPYTAADFENLPAQDL